MKSTHTHTHTHQNKTANHKTCTTHNLKPATVILAERGWGSGGNYSILQKELLNLQHLRAAVSHTSLSEAWVHVSVPGTQPSPRFFVAPSAPKAQKQPVYSRQLPLTWQVFCLFCCYCCCCLFCFCFFHNEAKTQIIIVYQTQLQLSWSNWHNLVLNAQLSICLSRLRWQDRNLLHDTAAQGIVVVIIWLWS